MKSKIVAMKRTEKEILIILEYKDESILKNVSSFLEGLGFPKFESNKVFSKMGDSEDNYSRRKFSDKLYADSYFFIENDRTTASIFFGNEKLMLALISKTKEFENVESVIEKYFQFPED